mgnify:CR=1 FL=1
MAEGDFTPQELMRLRTLYTEGRLNPEQRRDFEIEFPHLLPRPGTTRAEFPFYGLPSPTGGMPVIPTTPEARREFEQGSLEATKAIAPFATSFLGGAGGLAGGTALATRLSPYLGRAGAALLPLAGEAAGSLAARKLNVAAGLEEPGTGGDVLATAPSALRLARPFKQLFVKSLPEAEQQILKTQPHLSEAASDMILAGKAKGTPYERGRFVQEALKENEREINQQFGKILEPFKQNIPGMNISDIEDIARRLNVSLADTEVGSAIYRGRIINPGTGEANPFAQVNFDDAWQMRSRMQRLIHDFEDVDPLKSRAYTRVFHELDRRMHQNAEGVGLGQAWDDARALYKSEFVDRFRTKLFQKVTDTARTSGEDLVESGFRLNVEDAKSLVHSLGQLSMAHKLPPRVSHEAFRTGMLASALKDSVDEATGLLNARKFFNLFSHMPEEARDTLLGKELADAVLDFGRNTLQGVRRISFGIGAGGALTTGAIAGGRMAPVAAAETANEFTMIANRIARSPRIMRAITRAVLSSPADRLTRITASDIARLAGEGARPMLFEPPETP